MAWDFSTDPDFEADLGWVRRFVDETVLPHKLAGEGLECIEPEPVIEEAANALRRRARGFRLNRVRQ